MVSIVEQHVDGSWWYHPGETWATMAEAQEGYKEFWGKWHPERPYRLFEHDEPMCQQMATCTFDFKVFHFGGMIRWPKAREGELLRRGQNAKV